MILSLFRRDPQENLIRSLYGAIVAQARQPHFYLQHGVPDTVQGRFDMVLLHVFLFTHRLKGESEADRMLGQKLFDLFMRDMDSSLRELGIGDLSVPKKMKTMVSAFYGRTKVYDEAIAAGDRGLLAAALSRNIWAVDSDLRAFPLVEYVLDSVRVLQEQAVSDFSTGAISFAKSERTEGGAR